MLASVIVVGDGVCVYMYLFVCVCVRCVWGVYAHDQEVQNTMALCHVHIEHVICYDVMYTSYDTPCISIFSVQFGNDIISVRMHRRVRKGEFPAR